MSGLLVDIAKYVTECGEYTGKKIGYCLNQIKGTDSYPF